MRIIKMKKEQQTTLPTNENQAPATQDKVEMLPVSKLDGFKSHPFKVTENEDFKKLADSIMENGVLIPAVARPKGDGYELIAGHRRKAVCEKLGIETMPVILRDMTDEQSVIFMVDSNVQRENILPSEKAFAYKCYKTAGTANRPYFHANGMEVKRQGNCRNNWRIHRRE
ncbi:MAG: ParB/RepB/Spo0J family partition protein [Oscillospiraceae bacterium]|nr:ParB/RepB/Spo0J family partition protein [Oscillospiraceae bacterium]